MTPLFPPLALPRDEQDILATEVQRDWSRAGELLASIEGLVFHQCRRAAWSRLPVEDRYQLGMLGALLAIRNYRIEAGRFCWHAMRRIYVEMRRHAMVNGPVGHIPRHIAQQGPPAYQVVPVDDTLACTEPEYTVEDWHDLKEAIPSLSRRERYTLLCRARGMTYRAIGGEMGLSGEWVRLIANEAIGKLQERLSVE